ncbi:reverse transcriptase domain-containing protein, partial [Enterobacter cloacae complex sp. CH23B]|uniref:reverse transcriptase domain-containing protein n=1 Tax=Enterobacter cloacae complex sp. CH23B TaxID=2511986 RepID=UPI0013EBFE64
MERARSMRLHAGLPLELWAEAVGTSVYLINRAPSTALDGGVPEEAWTGKPVNYAFLKVFGCEAFMHIDRSLRSKLDAKSKKCFFIGYGEGDFGYRLWNPEDGKILRSRDVIFNEQNMYKDYLERKQTKETGDEYMEFEGGEDSRTANGDNVQQHQPNEEPQPIPRRSTRASRPPERFVPSFNHLLISDSGEPESYEDAMQHESKEKWTKSMQVEMDSLHRNQTWELVELPKGKRALQNKWVYKLKEEDGGKKRYKSRLVVKG